MMSEEWLDDDAQLSRFQVGVWKRLLRHALPYRSYFAGMALSGLVLALFEILLPVFTGKMIDEALKRGLTTSFYTYLGMYCVIHLVTVVFIWWFIVLAGRIATGVSYDLRQAGFAHLQKLSFSFYDVRSTGWLVSRLTSDCSKVSKLLPWFLLDLCWGGSLLLGATIAMFWLHWQLAIVVMLTIPPLIGVSLFFQLRLLKSSRLIRKTNSIITANVNESVMGVQTTQTLVKEQEQLETFQEQSGAMFTYTIRNALQSAMYLPLVSTIGSIGVGLALWVGGSNVFAQTGLTVGLLIAFMQYAMMMTLPVQELSARFAELQSAQAAAERVQGLLDTDPAIQDAEDVKAAIAMYQTDKSETQGASAEDGHEHDITSITFDDVGFAYKEGEPVLEHFDLHVKKGETIALVGATGSGKSTIVNLLARFYEPTSGKILINQTDARKRSLHWLQSQLGVVLQTPHLFTGTVRENIRYGRLDATDEEVEAAAEQVGVSAFLSSMPEGYDTQVGESGGRLSVGQRQLISLARAILSNPQIFIMDEATSSIDTETEQLIQSGIETLLTDRMAFVIAHRLSTIRNADRILVIDKGKIIEEGDHVALMKQRGRYYKLYTQQFVRETVDLVPSTPATELS